MKHSWKFALGAGVLVVVLPLAVLADDDQIRLEIDLVGTEFDPGAFGRARVDARPDRSRFEARIEAITQDTVVLVTAGPHFLGFVAFDDQGRGELRLDTQNGDEVPEIVAGDAVGIFSANDFTLLAMGELIAVN